MSKQHKKQPSPSPLVQPAANPEPPAAGFAFFEHAWLPQITVAAAAVLVWSACISNGFVFFDDDKAILYNHALQNPSFGKFFSGQNLGMYAPVSWIAYWVGSLISGQEAWGYHLLGVLLHALNAMLVFSLLCGLTRRPWAAFFAAMLFAVHPMQAEAVCWAAALSTVLFSTFYLGSALAWLRWRQGGGVTWLVGSLLVFVLACLSKSAAVTLPLVLLAMEWYVRRRPIPAQNTRNVPFYTYLPYFALSIWFGLNTFSTRTAEGHDIEQTSAAFSSLDRFWMVCQTILFYPVKLLLPVGYSISYPFVKMDGNWSPEYYAAPLMLAALGFLIWKKLISPNYPSEKITAQKITPPEITPPEITSPENTLLGIALYLLPLTVMLPFKTVGSFELRSDRYVYLSCIGLFFIGGILLEKLEMKVRTGILIVLGLVLGLLAFLQTSVWKDGISMFNNCVEKTPESSLCQCNLGYNKLISLDFQSAVNHYSEALKYDPSVVEAYNGRGQAYFNLRQVPQAYDDFDKAIKAGLSSPKLYLNRGKCLVMMGRSQQALPDLSKSIELEAKEPETWFFRGVAHEKTNDFNAAIADYARAAELRPGYVEALTNKGVLLLNERRLEEAITAFGQGINANPSLPMLHSNRANAYFQLGKYREAIRDASQAISLNNKYVPAYQIRGNAYLKIGEVAKGQADLQIK